MPDTDLRVLVLEDSLIDAELMMRALPDCGIRATARRVDTQEAFRDGLETFHPDLILADYLLPAFDGLKALTLAKEHRPDVPFIFVTGAMGEELAIETMKRGATDYVLKGKLAKLAPAVVRALREAADNRERLSVLKQLQDSEEKYRLHFENVNDLIFSMDWDFRMLTISPSVERLLGYKPEELIGKTIWDLDILTPTSLEKMASEMRRVLNGHRLEGILYGYRTKDGQKRYAEASAAPLYRGGSIVAFVCVSRDVTDRRQAEARLAENENKLKAIFDTVGTGILIIDRETRVITDANRHAAVIVGRSRKEIIGKACQSLICLPDDHSCPIKDLGQEIDIAERQLLHADGSLRDILKTVYPIKINERDCFVESFIDITERRQAEAMRKESETKLLAIFNTVGTGILIIDKETQVIQEANHHAAKISGRPREKLIGQACRAVVCPAPECKCPVKDLGQSIDDSERKLIHADGSVRDILKTVYPITLRGRECYVESFIDITERKRTAEALEESEEKYRGVLENMDEAYFEIDLSGNFVFFNNAECRHLGYSREELMGLNYKSYMEPSIVKNAFEQFHRLYQTGDPIKAIDLQYIRRDGTKGFSETSVALVKDKDGKPIGFRGLSRDISERKKHEEKLQRTLDSLRRAVGTTIQVMVAALEARDPYTAGHQLRVADLARAIGAEMGLSPEQLDGIRMGGSIHDIGKIAVPSEILTKPAKLTEIEFALMKEHARRGFEILKEVESPWPLAQIAYQHHERMDGKGYPRQLAGDEILIEARILGVADVVESMASHRPYRPALGLDAALNEIIKNRGILYDPAAVDACLNLFKEKNYRLVEA
ncbi:MAG: PAS domain S-box protein [Deltaproteobacteria bacterium]